MPTAENEQIYQTAILGEQTGKEYDFQSAESRPFTLTSKIDATLPRFQIKEGDMWESLNGRNQPLIQVAPAIVHETKLQHREVWELEWVLTVGWFWVVPLWPTVWLLTSLFIISVMAKIGYSAFKKLNCAGAVVRSDRLWSTVMFESFDQGLILHISINVSVFFLAGSSLWILCSHSSDVCGYIRLFGPSSTPLFFPPCVSWDCTALETRTFQRCCRAASKQKFQGNVWMFRLAGKDNSPLFCVPLFGWKLSLTFSNLIWSFIISQRKFSPVEACNIFPSCSWCATAGLPGDVRIPICSQNACIWGWPLQKLRMSTELFTTNSQSACEWVGKGMKFQFWLSYGFTFQVSHVCQKIN